MTGGAFGVTLLTFESFRKMSSELRLLYNFQMLRGFVSTCVYLFVSTLEQKKQNVITQVSRGQISAYYSNVWWISVEKHIVFVTK